MYRATISVLAALCIPSFCAAQFTIKPTNGDFEAGPLKPGPWKLTGSLFNPAVEKKKVVKAKESWALGNSLLLGQTFTTRACWIVAARI